MDESLSAVSRSQRRHKKHIEVHLLLVDIKHTPAKTSMWTGGRKGGFREKHEARHRRLEEAHLEHDTICHGMIST